MSLLGQYLLKSKGIKTTPTTSANQNLLKKYQALAFKKGVNIPTEAKPKKSLLKRIMDVLPMGAYWTAGIMKTAKEGFQTGDPAKFKESALRTMPWYGIYKANKERELPSEVMDIKGKVPGWKGTALSLGTDIALDPTTYVPGVVGAKILGKGLGVGGKVVSKIPIAKDIQKTLGVAFKPLYEVKKSLPPAMATKFENLLMGLYKGTRFESEQAIGGIVKMAREVGKTDIKAGMKIAKSIEKVPVRLSPKQIEAAGIIRQDLATMAKQESRRGILRSTIEGYVPHALTPEGRKIVEEAGGVTQAVNEFMSKPLRVKAKFAKGRIHEETITDINARLGKWLEEKTGRKGAEFFEADVFKPYAARKVASIKAVKTYDFMKGVQKNFSVPKPRKVQSVVMDGIKYVESSAPQLKGSLLPEPIVHEIDRVNEILGNDRTVNEILKIYDRALGFWKGSVTGIAPAFHIRNAIGGVFNNYLAGLTNPKRYAQAERLLDIKNKVGFVLKTPKYGKINGKRVLAEFAKRGGLGQTGQFDVMRTVEQGTEAAFKRGVRAAPQYPRKVMILIEDRIRLPLFIDRVAKGDTFDEAIKSVYKHQFDYAPEGLTAFERNVMRRIFPFYRWLRGNIPLQIESMLTQPRKYSPLGKLQKGRMTEEEEAALPEYIQEGYAIKTGKEGDTLKVLSSLGLPFEDIGRFWRGSPQRTLEREGIGAAAPGISWLYQFLSGRQPYYGKPTKELSYLSDDQGKRIEKMGEGFKKMIGFRIEKTKDKKKVYRVDPQKWSWFNTVGGRVAQGIVNPRSYLFPGKTYNVNMTKQKEAQQREYMKKIEEALIEAGEMREFRKAYIPKEKK